MIEKENRYRAIRITAALLSCVLLMAGSAAAEGQKPAKKAPPPKAKPADPKPPVVAYPGGFIERNAKRLGLSEETVQEMRAIVEQSRTENERLRGELEQGQAEMRSLLEKDVPDETAVMLQADRIGHLLLDQRKNQLRAMIKMRGMLTPEQRAELEKIRREHPSRREAVAPPGHGRPGPGAGAERAVPKTPPPAKAE